jgi:hypothetical protein
MNRIAKGRTTISLLAATIFFVGLANAQEGQSREAERTLTPLKVEIVFSKYEGEKLIARLPYTFVVSAGEDTPLAHFRMGIEVPVTISEDKVQYRNVGTNISCEARSLGDGRFQVDLVIERSSMYPAESQPGSGLALNGNPLFRTSNSNHSVIFRDGEKMELAKATDPVSGDVSKVEVSVEVLKK